MGREVQQPAILRFLETLVPLAGAGTFTGPWRDLGSEFPRWGVFVFADQAGTVFMDMSADGVNPIGGVVPTAGGGAFQVAYAANSYQQISTGPTHFRYARARFINGATPQTFFALALTASFAS